MQKTTIKEKVPLPIVYIRDGTVEVLPYLDLERKDEIWGIQSCGILWDKKQRCDCLWNKAADLSFLDGLAVGHIVLLPAIEQLKLLFNDFKIFNKTVEILRTNNVDADFLEAGWYFSKDVHNNFLVRVYNMETNEADVRDKLCIGYYSRGCICL